MKYFRADTDQLKAVEVECGEGVTGHRDADGKYIAANTHYLLEWQAWAWLEDDVKAGIKLAARRVIEAETALASAREQAGNAAKEFLQLEINKEERGKIKPQKI